MTWGCNMNALNDAQKTKHRNDPEGYYTLNLQFSLKNLPMLLQLPHSLSIVRKPDVYQVHSDDHQSYCDERKKKGSGTYETSHQGEKLYLPTLKQTIRTLPDSANLAEKRMSLYSFEGNFTLFRKKKKLYSLRSFSLEIYSLRSFSLLGERQVKRDSLKDRVAPLVN